MCNSLNECHVKMFQTLKNLIIIITFIIINIIITIIIIIIIKS